jgi:hypothetical protein
MRGGGSYEFVPDFRERYLADLARIMQPMLADVA